MFGAQAYKSTAVATASPWKLIDMLYEGAIQRIDQGLLEKAKLLVSEGLIAGLDPKVPFSKSYFEVYEQVIALLSHRDTAPTARQMLVELREGWQGIRDKVPA